MNLGEPSSLRSTSPTSFQNRSEINCHEIVLSSGEGGYDSLFTLPLFSCSIYLTLHTPLFRLVQTQYRSPNDFLSEKLTLNKTLGFQTILEGKAALFPMDKEG